MRKPFSAGLSLLFLCAVSSAAVICDFENEASMKVWKPGPQVTFTREHVSEGTAAARITLSAPLVASEAFPSNWSGNKAITCDTYNPGAPFAVNVTIRDAAGKAYVVKERVVPSGFGDITTDLVDASVNIDLSKVVFYSIEPVAGAPVVVMDNLRFLSINPDNRRILMDFENPRDVTLFEVKSGSLEHTAEHATHGRHAMKMAPNTYLVCWKMPPMWLGYDTFNVDFYNDTGAPVKLSLLVGDKAWVDSIPKGTSYWNRHNMTYMIPQGKYTFSISIMGLFRGEAGSRYNDLKSDIDPGNIVRVDFGFSPVGEAQGAIYMDNIRLEKAYIPQGLRAFDFGPESQPIQPGFKVVSWNTLYDKKTGYGMKRETGGPNWARDDTFPSKLLRDFVQLEKDWGAEFFLDLPNGRYHATLFFNDIGYWGGEAARHTKRTVSIDGSPVWVEDLSEKGGYRWKVNHLFENLEPLPGSDFWQLYMTAMYPPVKFSFDVTDGQMKLTVSTDAVWSAKVAGLIVYPDSMKIIGDKFVEDIIGQQRDEFTAAAVEIPNPARGKLEDVPQREKAKGYLFWVTDYEANYYLDTIPHPQEIKRSTAIAAAPGEREPVSFAVRPLGRDFGAARVTVSDFTARGAVIPASAWDVHVVRHLSRRGFSQISYSIIPQMLRPLADVHLKPDLTREFWAIVTVPQDALPGQYKGKITLASDMGLNETLDVTLTVRDFTLSRDTDYVFGFFGHPYNEKMAKFFLDHGFNSFSGGPYIGLAGFDADGAPQLDFSRVDAFMDMIKEVGYRHEICGYGGPGVSNVGYEKNQGFFGPCEQKTGKSYDELLKAVFDEVKKHADEKQWLPFTYNMCDEPRNPDNARRIVAQINAVQNAAPWLKTTGQYSVTYKDGAKPDDYHQWVFEALKSSGLNLHDESVMHKARELGKEIYIYNQGQSRYSFGLYQVSEYVKGVRGRYQWHQHVQHGYQFFDLDGREPDTGIIYLGEDGPIPTLNFIRSSEGADDFYYFVTLTEYIARGEKAGGRAGREAVAARNALNDWVSKIRLNERSKPDWVHNDEFRSMCATHVARIKALIR